MSGSATSPTSGTRDAIRGALRAAAGPLTIAQIRKALPKPFRVVAGEVQLLLESLVAAGEAHAWGSAKSPRFWSRSRAEALPGRVLGVLRSGPCSPVALAKLVARILPGCAASDVKPEIEAMAKDGRVRTHPPVKGRTPAYGLGPPDPVLYLDTVKKAMDATCVKLARHGVERERVVAALRGLLGGGAADATPPAADLPAAILAVVRLVSYRGVLAISLLRKLLNRPKPEFDAAVLELKAKGLVLLHAHHGPLALPAEERYELVDDGRGTYFVGVGLR